MTHLEILIHHSWNDLKKYCARCFRFLWTAYFYIAFSTEWLLKCVHIGRLDYKLYDFAYHSNWVSKLMIMSVRFKDFSLAKKLLLCIYMEYMQHVMFKWVPIHKVQATPHFQINWCKLGSVFFYFGNFFVKKLALC